MKISYDPTYNVAYIQLREAPDGPVQNVKIADDVIADLDSDGKLFGIEILNASEFLNANSVFSFVNEATKVKRTLAFA